MKNNALNKETNIKSKDYTFIFIIYIEQFLDEEKEFYIGILVLAKYFYYSNQIKLPKEILSLIKG